MLVDVKRLGTRDKQLRVQTYNDWYLAGEKSFAASTSYLITASW